MLLRIIHMQFNNLVAKLQCVCNDSLVAFSCQTLMNKQILIIISSLKFSNKIRPTINADQSESKETKTDSNAIYITFISRGDTTVFTMEYLQNLMENNYQMLEDTVLSDHDSNMLKYEQCTKY